MSDVLNKPYGLQVPNDVWPDDEDIDNWMDSLNAPILNMLIGPPKCGKTTFINSYGLQSRGSKATVSRRTTQNVTDPLIEINMVDQYWTNEELYQCIANEEAIVLDQENLVRKERERFLNMFPSNYWKVAIVWELSDDELLYRGCSQSQIEEKDIKYERPDPDEDFDELVYIFS